MLVQLTVQVEQDVYETLARSIDAVYRDVVDDAVRKVRRELGQVATLVGEPAVRSVITPDQNVPMPKEEPAS